MTSLSRTHIRTLAAVVFACSTAHAGLNLFPGDAHSVRAEQLPPAIADREFWRIVSEFSEPTGRFQLQYMSNEDSYQFVMPALTAAAPREGVYLGVGPEQNFTYIAAIQPRLAFIIDIRRENMIEHLMYKALFELSADRAEFVSRLFSRRRPAGLGTDAAVGALFDAYRASEPDAALSDESVRLIMNRLEGVHGFQLSETDRAGLTRMMNTFRDAGPYALKGSGDKNETYAQMMEAADLSGRQQSYLASEDHFKAVQQLERRNLIVPIVGDFAGDRALASIGSYLKEHDAAVNVFYVSNVERYLFEQGDHGRQFYANVGALPLSASSIFIRSVTVDISRRLGIKLPDSTANWRSFLFPIADCLNALSIGRIQTYRDLFEVAR
jgi:hypothetical protein